MAGNRPIFRIQWQRTGKQRRKVKINFNSSLSNMTLVWKTFFSIAYDNRDEN